VKNDYKTSEFIIYVVNIFKTYLFDLFDEDVPGLNIQHRSEPRDYFVEFTCETEELGENVPKRIKKVFEQYFNVTEVQEFMDKDVEYDE
jgi:hypothetical protein